MKQKKKYTTKDFEKANRSNKAMDSGYEVYSYQKPIMNAVLGWFPWMGDLITESIDVAFNKAQNSKRMKLIEVISQNRDVVTSEMVSNNEFITNVARTVEMVDRLSTNDKVVYFGNLIRNGYLTEDECINTDDFDEFAAILNDLSYREIDYLIQFAENARMEDNNILQGKQLTKFCNSMKAYYQESNPVFALRRIRRTGLVDEVIVWASLDDESHELDELNNKSDLNVAFQLSTDYDYFERMVLKNTGGYE